MSKKEKDQKTESKVETPVEESTSAESTATGPTTESAPNGLNVGDLKRCVQIIQTCSKRGAFNADELQIVGQTYTNLMAFLVSTGAIKDPAKEVPGTPVPEAQADSDPQTETPAEATPPSDVEPTKE